MNWLKMQYFNLQFYESIFITHHFYQLFCITILVHSFNKVTYTYPPYLKWKVHKSFKDCSGPAANHLIPKLSNFKKPLN